MNSRRGCWSALSNPFDGQSIEAGLNAFSGNTSPNKFGVYVVAINDPQIARVCQDGQPATAMVEHAAHPLSSLAAITERRIHLDPQKARTFRTYDGVSPLSGIPPARSTAPGPAL